MAESTGVNVHATRNPSMRRSTGRHIVVTITNSAEPVLRADHVRPGMTVIAAGNNTWLRSEIEPAVVARADLVVVDDIENAQARGGRAHARRRAGLFSWDRVVALR